VRIGTASVPPLADAGGPYAGTPGAAVNFDGTGSSDLEGDISTYAWDFGDPNDLTPGTGPKPQHTYAETGPYIVRLTVTDASGETDTDVAKVIVGEGGLPPLADAGGPYQGAVVGALVSFDGTGSRDLNGGGIDSYDWNFGDGTTGSGATPSHTYSEGGFHLVTLTVTNSAGTKNSDTTLAVVRVFNDVPPGYWAEESIYKVYANGITSGCGGGNYCPEDPVTRAQMAVFLEKGINGSDYDPPGATGIFDDVPVSYWVADWVEQFYNDGITSGCSTDPPLYCPDDLVLRAKMAVFLLRSIYGKDYRPPSAVGIFDDVPVTHSDANWIEALYNEGITAGCSADPLLYCPDDLVTRDEMAVFIVLTFDL
jgi:chitodextrinase